MILQTIHSNKRTLGGILIISVVALMMTGFGLGALGKGMRPEEVAITINESKVPFTTFYSKRRELEDRMRQMFGKQFDSAYQMMGRTLNNQVKEQVINEHLVSAQATALDLEAGDRQIQELLATYFQSGENYKNFLASKGQSASQFQEELRDSLKREAFNSLLSSAMVASKAEVKTLTTKSLTKRSGNVATFSPADFEQKVPTPSASELEAYYTENASKYELPAQVKYSYAKISKESVADLIEVTPDMLAIYYSDHSGLFRIAAGSKIRQFSVDFDPSKPEEKAKAKAELTALRQELTKGSAWDVTAQKISAQKGTKIKHLDLGWISAGQLEPALASAAATAELKTPTEILEGARSFSILNVVERREDGMKPLSEVSEEIKSRILAEESPSYIASLAEEVYEQINKGTEFSEAIKNRAKAAVVTVSDFTAKDPDGLPGLKEKIISESKNKYQIHHLPSASVLVRVDEFKEPEIPGLPTISEKVLADYRKEKSVGVAEAAAREVASNAKKPGDLEKLAKENFGKIQPFADTTAEAPGPVLQRSTELQAAVTLSNQPSALGKSFSGGGVFLAAEVNKVEPPTNEEIEKSLSRFETQAKDRLAQLENQAIIKALRATATISVNPRIEAE